ncbi:MAG: inositol monophosphatase family protein [Lachnospiraceae bacterium]|nr:inositol monophosphatase family protein [Lachnospiraceae bacterium]
MNLQVDFDAVTDLVLQTRKFFSDEDKRGDVTVKGRADFVTQVDFAVQCFLQKELEKLYPEIQFLGEEGGKEARDSQKPMWILDPVDGTTNLIRDLQMSVVSLALWDGEDLVFGCIYHPYREELCTAVRSQGTRLNGRPVSVSTAETAAESLFCVGTSPYEKAEYADTAFAQMKQVFLAGLDIRRTASAAMDHMYVAVGRIDGYFEHYLKPWDCAAGIILVEEAGGRVTDFRGKKVNVLDCPDVVVSNGKIHNEFLKLLDVEGKRDE